MEQYERSVSQLVEMIENKDFYGLDDFIEKQDKLAMTEVRDARGYSMLHIACYKNIESVAFWLIRKVKDKQGEKALREWVIARTTDEEF